MREIAEMEWLLDDIDEHGLATSEQEQEERPVPEFTAQGERVAAASRLLVDRLPLAPGSPGPA